MSQKVPLPQPVAFTRRQSAAYISVCDRTIDRLVSEGKLPIVKIGAKVLIRKEDLDAFLATAQFSE